MFILGRGGQVWEGVSEAAYFYDDLTTFEISAIFHRRFYFRFVCVAMVSALIDFFFCEKCAKKILEMSPLGNDS